MTYLNKRTGETYEGFEGIDPGFEHNPGSSIDQALKNQLDKRLNNV